MSTALSLLGLLALLAGSAVFSAAETSVSAANRLRLSTAAEEGSRRAKTALALLERYEDALSAILMGNNLCNIGADSLATVLALGLLSGRSRALAPVLTTVVMTLVIVVFCESAPKISARKNANRWTVGLAPFLRLLTLALLPLVLLVRLLIRLLTLPFPGERREEEPEAAAAELQSIIETVEDEGIIDGDRSELLRSALDFSQISVMDVMTARVDVQALDADGDWEELLLGGEEEPYSRLPVYEGSIDNVIGVLHLNRFFRALLDEPRPDIRVHMMPPMFVYKTVKLPDVLSQLRRSQQHLAVVTDEYGGTLGIVTLEDVLEQLVGEIWDETDEVEEDVIARPDGAFELDGDLSLGEFAALMGVREEELSDHSATVGGWVIEHFGAFPRAGDALTAKGIRARVLEMDPEGLRVEKLVARREPDTEE